MLRARGTQGAHKPAQWLPYTVPRSPEGEYAGISSREDWWGPMPDPFDPRFVAAADRMARDAAARFGGASYLIGYFVDNEVNWGKDWSNDPRERNSVAIGALAADRESPAKSAFIEQLVETYRLPERLGDVRGTDLLLG